LTATRHIAADNDIIDTAVAAVSSKLWLPPLMPCSDGAQNRFAPTVVSML
jgi:hypothetical protein